MVRLGTGRLPALFRPDPDAGRRELGHLGLGRSIPSGPRQTDCNLSSFFRARCTFSRISEAVAVQMKGFGF